MGASNTGRLAAVAALLLLLGCSSGGSTGGGGGGSATGGGSAAGGGSAGGGTGAGGGGAATGGGGASGLTCANYCNTVMTNCTGAHQLYLTNDTCLNSCATFPPGTLADSSGNTLGCRLHFAAASDTDPTQCTHAGPGGDGVCGQNCVGYCQIVMRYCAPPALPGTIYTDENDCLTTCGKFRDDAGYSVTNLPLQASGTTACLLYHAQESSVVPEFHCHQDLSKVDGGNLSKSCNDGPDAGP